MVVPSSPEWQNLLRIVDLFRNISTVCKHSVVNTGTSITAKTRMKEKMDMEVEAPAATVVHRTPPPGKPYSTRATRISSPPARPVRLVYCDEKGKFQMDPEAVAALQLVKGPVAVVSVCGRARQGKSFILNQLLGQSSGFEVAATHRPCTKGLWMWSTPIKRTAADGSEYNLLLLDSEGIDSYDQTGTYSVQIFTLAVLLSSMFVYNQMNGIDEAALDNLSLVTKMTKHIQVRASQGATSADELGQFAPLFVWLLRDFYLDLTKDGRKISPRDYLESALQPLPGSGRAIAAKNEIRNSIRALFPERECFTLVRPLEAEQELQHLDEIPMEHLREEFKTGMDTLTKYMLERARPKQLGSIVLTGPMLAGLAQSFLDAINSGGVPTIATSWQNVEEKECRRAHDLAIETYTRSFNRSTPPEEVPLQEAQEKALQAALHVFNTEAVGGGTARKKYERQLYITAKKQFDTYKRKVFLEAELKCLRTVGSLEERLRKACHLPNASYESLVKVIEGLVAEYEMSAYGSFKWQKLVKFLENSLTGPLQDLVIRARDRLTAQYSSLEIKFSSMEETVYLAQNQVEVAQKDAHEWKKRYELAMADYKKASENSSLQYSALQKKVTTFKERQAVLTTKLEETQKEASEWQVKYERLLSERQRDEGHLTYQLKSLQKRCTTAEARLAAMCEQCASAKEEAAEWRYKYDAIAADTKEAVERANVKRDRTIKEGQIREDALRAQIAATVAQKDGEIKDLQAKVEQGEGRIISLTSCLHEQEEKSRSQEEQVAMLKSELQQLHGEFETLTSTTTTLKKDFEKGRREKLSAERQATQALKRVEEAERRCEVAEKNSKNATSVADKAKKKAAFLEKEKLESQRLAVERLAAVERSEQQCNTLEREREELIEELHQNKLVGREAIMRVTSLELRLEEREKEVEKLLKSLNEQRARTVEVFESLLTSERAAKVEAAKRAEALSLQLQSVQGELDALQTQLMSVRNHETALDSKLKSYADMPTISPSTTFHGKRTWAETYITPPPGDNNKKEMSHTTRRSKKNKSIENASSWVDTTDDEVHITPNVARGQISSSQLVQGQDYHNLTAGKLKQKLVGAGFTDELAQLRSHPTKKDLIALYEKLIPDT